jgi:hypothetical protein
MRFRPRFTMRELWLTLVIGMGITWKMDVTAGANAKSKC